MGIEAASFQLQASRGLAQQSPKRDLDRLFSFFAGVIKSLDLNAATYQDFGRLSSAFDKSLNKLENYNGTNWGGDEVTSSEIVGRTLHVIIPGDALKSFQSTAIWSAHIRAISKGIDLTITRY